MAGWSVRYPALISLSILLTSCSTYHARPLSEVEHDPSLVGPAPDTLAAAVAEVHHPHLIDVPIDLTRALGPDQVALLAVALQPAVRAVRMQRKLAHAQVIQAGLLPNPQLSLSTDLPLNGEDTVPALGAGLSWEITALIAASSSRK